MTTLLNKRHLLAYCGALLFWGVAAGQLNAAETRTITHAQGEVQITGIPQRVAVLDLASLDTLDALGIDVVGVPSGNKNWPDYLQKFSDAKYTQVGSLFEPNLDAIKELKPDLIIVAGRSRGKINDLSAIAPTIDLSTSTTGFVPSVIQNILTLGAIFGKEKEANAKASELLVKVRALQEKASGQGKGALMFAVGENVSVHSPNTRFGIVYELIGIEPVVSATDNPQSGGRGRGGRGGRDNAAPAENADAIPAGGQQAGRRGGRGSQGGSGAAENPDADAARTQRAEAANKTLATIFEKQPHWIFVIDRNSAFKERENAQELLAANPVIAKSEAWNNQHVVHLSGVGWYLIGGGVTQIENTIDQVSQAFDK